MKKETKSKLVDFIIQITSVTIGVYLGFMVSNLSEDRKLKGQLNVFESSIRTEINTNKNKIEKVIHYHIMLRDSSRYYLSSGKRITERPAFLKGLRTPNLISSAYKTGIQTGIINALPIDKIQTFNQVYNLQKAYNEYIIASVPSLLRAYLNDQKPGKLLRYLSVTMTDFVIKEEALLKLYKDQLQIQNDTLDARRILTGRFAYQNIMKGEKTGTFVLTIYPQQDGTYQFTGEGGDDLNKQQWSSSATASLKPVSAKLKFRKDGKITLQMDIAYDERHVSGHITRYDSPAIKEAKKKIIEAKIPSRTLDQRIDWASVLAADLKSGKTLRPFFVYDPSSGVGRFTGEVVGEELIHVPAGTYNTYHIIYHITKPDETETYEVWLTKETPRMMVREKFSWGLVSELARITQ